MGRSRREEEEERSSRREERSRRRQDRVDGGFCGGEGGVGSRRRSQTCLDAGVGEMGCFCLSSSLHLSHCHSLNYSARVAGGERQGYVANSAGDK